MNKLLKIAILISSVLISLTAMAQSGPQSFFYEGRLLDSSGNPSTASSVQFILEVYNPAGTCLLRRETSTAMDMNGSAGYFSVGIGVSTNTVNYSAGPLATIFNNTAVIVGQSSCTYAPSGADARLLKVSVYDGTTTTALSPGLTIGVSPFATVAETANQCSSATSLQGKTPTDFVLSATTFGAMLPSFSVTPSAPIGGSLWFDSSLHTLKYYDGSATQTLATAAGGGITAAIGNAPIATSVTAGTITVGLVASGVAAGNYNQVTVNGQGLVTAGTTIAPTLPGLGNGMIWIGNGSNIAGAVSPSGDVTISNTGVFAVTKMQGQMVSASLPSSGQLLQYTGSQWMPTTPTFFPMSGGALSGPLAMSSGNLTVLGGSVGIGTSSPAYKLDVTGDVNINASYAFRFGGTSVCTSVGCTSSSDRRLKENILPLQSSLEKVMQLEGVSYNYKDKTKFTGENQIGVIAQDVEKVFPEVVRTDSKTGLKSVAYDHLVAPMIEAMKEQQRQISSLKEQNEQMRAELDQIKAQLSQH